jgi:hypothetical protein
MKKPSLLILLASSLILLLVTGRLAAQADRTGFVHHTVTTSYPDNVPPRWMVERIAPSVRFQHMSDRSLAVDAAGRPHLVYGLYDLFYAWHDGTKWHQEVLATTSLNSGAYVSIALDPAGNPHIAYTQINGNWLELWYAHRANNQWIYVYLDRSNYISSTSIAIDSLGYPHIAYDAGPERGLSYVHQNNAGWYWYTIDEGAARGNVSLALDSINHAHISYTVVNDYTVKYAMWTGSQWQIQIIAPISTNNIAPVATSIAVNNQDQPVIAYQAREGIRLAAGTAGGWNIEVMNNDAYSSWLSLALDANNTPHLSYYDSFIDGLMYATRPAAIWLTMPVDTEYEAGHYNSIALDAAGQPHISYGRYDNPLYPHGIGDMRYARLSNNQWLVETLQTSGSYWNHTLTIDSANRLHLIYLEQSDSQEQWYYLYQTESGWTREPLNLDIGWPSVLVMDANDALHFAYTLGGKLYYAYGDNNQWNSQLVSESYNPGPISFALDQNQNPHIAFYLGLADQTLYYTYLNETSWIVETVDDAIYSPRFVSLEVDSQNRPHIAYNDDNSHDLRYAHRPAGTWISQTLTSYAEAASLALDSQDYPHIAWTAGGFGTTDYFHWTGNSWVNETVGESEGFFVHPARFLFLDGNDMPHVVYPNRGDGLTYAYRDSTGSWITEPVPQSEAWGTFHVASIVLNSRGTPFVIDMNDTTDRLALFSLANLTYSPLIFKP